MSTPTGAPVPDSLGFEEPHQFQSQAGLTDFGESVEPAASNEPPATEGQAAPGQQQPTGAPPAPQTQQQPPQPQTSGQQGQAVSVEQFMSDNGLKPEQVLTALNEYMFLASPEGQAQWEGAVEQRVSQRIEAQRRDIVKKEMAGLLQSDEGRYALYQALQRAGGVPGVQQQQQQQQYGEAPEQGQQSQAPPPWARQLQQEVASLRATAQQFTNQTAGQQQQVAELNQQQQMASEFDSFIQQNPEAAVIQNELAQDVIARVNQRPDLYRRPGAVAYEANRLFQRYRTSATRYGAPPRVPAPGAPGSNTGSGFVSRPAAPRNEENLIGSVLAEINNYQGGGR